MFNIKSINILDGCQHVKNLETGEFTFNAPVIKDFYGDKISLHAIVGKNGSGKSSISKLLNIKFDDFYFKLSLFANLLLVAILSGFVLVYRFKNGVWL